MNLFSNVLGICSFLGTAGYNYHARGFFTALNKYLPVAIKNWSHDPNPYYLTNEQKAMMASVSGSSYTPGSCITICLHETNHEDWYKNTFRSPKIAFNVWESTKQPQQFFDKLLEFDQIWVPSEWQKECTIEQGAPAEKIFVIPEGFDTERFKVRNCDVIAKFSSPYKYTFLLAGRWEYRKATTEIIRTFIDAFKGQDDVELLLLVDNPFDRQKLSTEEKMTKYGLQDDKIKIIHKLSQEDYDTLLQETDCFLSCSRAEGWNLPLMEAMACGIPSVCSNWSGQLEFAEGQAAFLVDCKNLIPAWSEFGEFPGYYKEPDFKKLGDIMKYMVAHSDAEKSSALRAAEHLKKYTWDNAAQIALKAIGKLDGNYDSNSPFVPEIESPKSPIGGIVLPHTVKFVKPEVKEKKEVKPKYRSKDIFVIDCYPNTIEKMEKLAKTVISIKEKYDKPIAVVSHLEISKEVHSNVDYYIYDADNTLPDYRLPVIYTFENLKLTGRLDRPYHSLPIIKSLQNVCKMFSNFERIHFLEYDINVDLDKHLSNVADHKDKDLVSYYYEGTGIYTNIMSFRPSFMLDLLTTRTITWDEYKRMVHPLLWEQDLIFENWIYKVLTIAKKNDDVVILNASSVDMRRDSFKEMPKYNVIFSELEADSNYIMFIVHRGMNSKDFRVYFTNHANLPYKMSLTDCGEYSYVIFDKGIDEVNLQVGQITDPTYVMSQQTMGEFIFYDREIKCKEINRLKGMNTEHNVQIKNFFIDGGFVELLGPDSPDKYTVTFTDRLTGQVVLKSDIGINCWTRTNRKYFTDWNVRIDCGDTEIYNTDISYFQRRVMIVLDSKAMGDTLAWFPMVEEFRKKHNAQIIVVTYWNKFFKDKYPDMEFAEPGSVVPDIFAQFNVGCFDNDLNKNKFNWRITPLQKVAADQLGVSPWKESIPNISFKIMDRPIKEKYVAISEHSTFLSKYWLREGGWDTVIKYLNDKGYKVAAISKENTEQRNVISLTGRPIEETLNNIHHADLFIGMSSGPSWLSWALRKPLVLISGYSTRWAEMDPNNPLVARVVNEDVCHGCFNDPSLPLERGNWRWCPRGRDFECSKMISSDMVIAAIDKLL